jgi:hypothetical protein
LIQQFRFHDIIFAIIFRRRHIERVVRHIVLREPVLGAAPVDLLPPRAKNDPVAIPLKYLDQLDDVGPGDVEVHGGVEAFQFFGFTSR